MGLLPQLGHRHLCLSSQFAFEEVDLLSARLPSKLLVVSRHFQTVLQLLPHRVALSPESFRDCLRFSPELRLSAFRLALQPRHILHTLPPRLFHTLPRLLFRSLHLGSRLASYLLHFLFHFQLHPFCLLSQSCLRCVQLLGQSFHFHFRIDSVFCHLPLQHTLSLCSLSVRRFQPLHLVLQVLDFVLQTRTMSLLCHQSLFVDFRGLLNLA
mmetsp:Transcript_21185/g.50244  ORF Transcript_21185/g.50244 Transcript_21185/m.50244 type:complete len:211 (-) Transcript_21185:593-1225(-)